MFRRIRQNQIRVDVSQAPVFGCVAVLARGITVPLGGSGVTALNHTAVCAAALAGAVTAALAGVAALAGAVAAALAGITALAGAVSAALAGVAALSGAVAAALAGVAALATRRKIPKPPKTRNSRTCSATLLQ